MTNKDSSRPVFRLRKTLQFAQLQLMTEQARASASPEVLPAENPFALPEWGCLRNDCKRRRRRRPEGVAHSTSFTPIESHQHAPRAFAMAVHFSAPGSRPRFRDANQLRPTLEARCWPGSLMPSYPPSTPLEHQNSPLLFTFSLFSILLTHYLAHHDGTTTVALLQRGRGKR